MILKNARILVIDDDIDILTAVRLLLKTEAAEVITEKNPENIRSILYKNHFDLILLDMNFNSAINTGNEGLYWLRKIREWDAATSVVMITAYGDIDLAVRSLKEGAEDFIVKPWHNEKLTTTIREVLQKKDGTAVAKSNTTITGQSETPFIGQSSAIRDILSKVEKIAPTDANILILGENGTGKDLMARIIHERSGRSTKQFVKVDVGALTETLFESELFGHKKGAFTDARDDRTGRFEMASGGTLFLDEIGNISLQQQAKLLSVIQNRQVSRLGSNLLTPVDIRLICATNLPLSELANETRFRKDLIYRINTVEITMPPLRKRPEDIPPLAQEFARLYAAKYLKRSLEIEIKAIEKLKAYHFPGNVRELQYSIERAVIMCEGNEIRAEDIIFSPLETIKETEESDSGNLTLSTMEKNTILKVIEKHQGNISRAARELGLTRTALYRRLSKYDI
jgi:two-component system, NtrC family, response regulator HydG